MQDSFKDRLEINADYIKDSLKKRLPRGYVIKVRLRKIPLYLMERELKSSRGSYNSRILFMMKLCVRNKQKLLYYDINYKKPNGSTGSESCFINFDSMDMTIKELAERLTSTP